MHCPRSTMSMHDNNYVSMPCLQLVYLAELGIDNFFLVPIIDKSDCWILNPIIDILIIR
jgi:hypothetical protein